MAVPLLQSARSLVLTTLGELVFPEDDWTPTSALLHVLGGLGVEERTARQALSRCAAAGWVESERVGRDAQWRLTPAGRTLVAESIERVYTLDAEPAPWDGRWLVLLVPVPHAQRAARKRLNQALSWAGFGNPAPGLWLTPHTEREGEARAIVDGLGLADTALSFTGPSASVGMTDADIVERGWDLAEATGLYEQLLARLRDPGDDVLLVQVELVGALGRMPFLDPQLPPELLPDWIGREVMGRFAEHRAAHSQAARDRFGELTAGTPASPSSPRRRAA